MPRYQVSVYRTIGPLVYLIFFILADIKDIHECLNDFESRQNLSSNYGIICPWASEKSINDLVTTLAF